MNSNIPYIWVDLHDELKKFISLKVHDKSTADDILQEVFIKIHLNIHQLKDPSKLTAWVYQITRNTLTDYFKQTNLSRNAIPVDLAEEDSKDDIYQSLSHCINSKIAKLTPQDREAVLLTYFKNYSQKDLADFLGISYSGVKNRVQRTREKLKQALLNCENVEADTKGNITDFHGKIM